MTGREPSAASMNEDILKGCNSLEWSTKAHFHCVLYRVYKWLSPLLWRMRSLQKRKRKGINLNSWYWNWKWRKQARYWGAMPLRRSYSYWEVWLTGMPFRLWHGWLEATVSLEACQDKEMLSLPHLKWDLCPCSHMKLLLWGWGWRNGSRVCGGVMWFACHWNSERIKVKCLPVRLQRQPTIIKI